MRIAVRLAALALCACAAAPSAASAVTLDPIASAGTFTEPTYVTSDPADPNDLFVIERQGLILQTENGVTSTFADLRSRVTCCLGERGLLSMALAPDFPETGRFYVDYTRADDPATTAVNELGDVRVDELHATGGSVPAAEVPRRILEIEHSSQSNHNGGQLQFGPDGYLYVSVGDGGGGGDPFHSGQSTTTLLGKILRIDPDASGGAAYTSPATNPFFAGPGEDEIYSYGLRNPWRFSFDRLNGDLMIGDVGQNLHEEIDYAPSAGGRGIGADFGWNCREGLSPYTSPGPECAGLTGFTEPILDYPHSDPGGGVAHGCSITGGYVVRDPTLTGLYGRYLYADYCTGDIRSLTPTLPGATDDRSEGLPALTGPTSFGQDACGRLYVTSDAGPVYRFVEGAPAACTTLNVAVEGDPRGTVTGPGIACPGDCHESSASPGTVSITAAATGLVDFTGWSGACSGQGAVCTLDLSTDRSTTAHFLHGDPTGPIDSGVVLRAAHRRVPHGSRAKLVAKLRSCRRAAHTRVILRRDGEAFGSKPTNGCRATFHPRIGSAHRFRAVVAADPTHLRSRSKLVRVRPRR